MAILAVSESGLPALRVLGNHGKSPEAESASFKGTIDRLSHWLPLEKLRETQKITTRADIRVDSSNKTIPPSAEPLDEEDERIEFSTKPE
jgi:hypothetical protein